MFWSILVCVFLSYVSIILYLPTDSFIYNVAQQFFSLYLSLYIYSNSIFVWYTNVVIVYSSTYLSARNSCNIIKHFLE